MTVTASPGNTVLTLVDDGVVPDLAADDGIYSAAFVPDAAGAFILTFPDMTTVTVEVLPATSYSAQPTVFNFRPITGVNLGLDDETSARVTPPFPILFAGRRFSTLVVGSNGNLNFTMTFDEFANAPLPTASLIGPLIAPFWDDLLPIAPSARNVFWEAIGTTPNRELVVEWRNTRAFLCGAAETVTFQVVFTENRSHILFNYADTGFGGTCAFRDRGGSATIGVQSSPTVAGQFSLNTRSVSDGTAVLWALPGGVPGGTFTDESLTGRVIKVIHIAELRTRIDALRGRFGVGPAAWTDSSLLSGVTVARAQHLLDLREALTVAYEAAGVTPPTFADSPLEPGRTIIRAAHLVELRAAVIAREQR